MNSLGFDKDPKNTRVVVAMSGGVDSSVVAALLHEEGYDVVGVTLQLYDHGKAICESSKTCCAGEDIYDAKRVAEKLGFPHYILNYQTRFHDNVIKDFAESYMKGLTPLPCVRCNQSVKFRDLLEVARDLEADCMATGHYIQRIITSKTGKAELHRAIDPAKDQSYFLFATTAEQLDFLRFPLGGWSKDVTRAHAERLSLKNASKPDSQDICFVPDGDYASVVKKLHPSSENHGDIIHIDGRVVGEHKGIIHYTIGQRKGLGIGGGVSEDNSPFYVIEINAAENQIIIGPKEALARDIIMLEECNWLVDIEENTSRSCTIKFRSIMRPVEAVVEKTSPTDARITLKRSQYGIAPGQAVACYEDEKMLGGGWIITTQKKGE